MCVCVCVCVGSCVSCRLLPTPADAGSVARFFRECHALDKELIGAFISEPPDKKHEVWASLPVVVVLWHDVRV